MEQMKVSSVVKAYPNSFVLGHVVSRERSGRVSSLAVVGVFQTKQEAMVGQAIWDLLNIKTLIIPTVEEGLCIKLSDDNYEAASLFTPAESAKMYRDYWGF